MYIIGIFMAFVRFLLLVIFRGFLGGGILLGVSSLLKIGKSDYSECFAASAYAHAVEIIILMVLNGFAYIYMLIDPGFHGFHGFGTLHGTSPPIGFTIFRAVVLTVLYTYYTIKFVKTSMGNAFTSSVITVILYFLLASLIGYIMQNSFPLYTISRLPSWL